MWLYGGAEQGELLHVRSSHCTLASPLANDALHANIGFGTWGEFLGDIGEVGQVCVCVCVRLSFSRRLLVMGNRWFDGVEHHVEYVFIFGGGFVADAERRVCLL